jgi:ABC-type transport system involved in multi-copper enzyme maturation permease subunit
MLANIAKFEIRQQLKAPVFWITAAVFFWFAFTLTYSDEIQFGWGGYVVRNSPYTVALTVMVLTVFAVFIATTFAATVVLRDDETGFGPIIRATPVTRADYLFGRFAGGFIVSCLVYLSVPLGAFFGAAIPGLDPETVGRFRAVSYLYSYFVLAVPTLFVLCAGVFAFATLTRSMLATYVVALVGLLLYFLSAIYGRRAEFINLATWSDPFGLTAMGRDVANWTPAERNAELVPMAGRLLRNRLLWVAVMTGALALTWRLFKRERTAETKRPKETARDVEATRAPAAAQVALPGADRRALGWGPLLTLTRFDVRSVVRSPAFFVLVGITLLNAIIGLNVAGDDTVSITLPVTRLMIQTLFTQFSIYPLLIAAYYAGELVWRDRERRVHEILDATPAADWAFLAPKIIAITIVLVALALGSVGAAVLVQLAKGYTTLELGHYAVWYVLPWVVNMMLFAVLAVFIQTLVPHKFLGLLVVVLVLAGQQSLTRLGFEHNLYQFAGTSAVPLSDMNGQGNFARYAAWFRAYWTAFAAILTVLAWALWRRGASSPLKSRLQRLPTRLRGAPGVAVAVLALLMAGVGGYIYYNTNVLNQYRALQDSQRWQADYERTLLPLEQVPQPKVTDVTLRVDLYPGESRVVTRGSYIVENKTSAPMQEIHVSWARGHEQRSFLGTLLVGDLVMQSLEIDGASLTKDHEDLHYRIYTFDRPLEPGQKTEVRFQTLRQQRGFRNSNNEVRVVENGTFLDNFQITPWLGMSRHMVLQDRTVRRKYGLVPELRPPKLEDSSARAFNYFRHDADWVNAEVTVSSVPDQVVVAPGHLEESRVVDGRKVWRFKTESPINFFFSIQSARYAVREDTWQDVGLAVYHHPAHDFSVDRMLKAMKASLDYYSTNFSPFQFRQMRIVEFPAYMNFAQAFPGTVPYSEAAGFIIDARDSSRLDGITYVTAHEVGHQWWAHQVIGADMQGQTVLSETLAQYSALMVMERVYGISEIRRFLKGSLDGYLRGRATDRIGEVPLARVEEQAHIRYQKGGLVMYLLRDVMGEEAVNRALRSLLETYRLKGPPFANSQDLIDRLRLEAGPEHQQLITDLFEKITLYDLKVTGGRASRREDGKWDVAIDVEARKLYADEKGVETEAPVDATFDVGVFTSEPGKKGFTAEGILSLERQRVTSGKHTLTVVVDREPRFVGLDPYNKYVDRNSDDNVKAVQ